MSSDKAYSLAFLVQTNDPVIENNLYPFVFLNTNGNLFIFQQITTRLCLIIRGTKF
ncbi:putative glyoxal oxidase [Helianthus annuus]|uniref:Glyoxal oxidase n=1 Tax=Helianthus annuus TaxID=4232 RepID=A0A9K3DE61_HELAN|nr:putative glyoxal oxidase [Helianthus annuus]KAJ0811231.1 putative glyoxal oxidase [Helianthus annuus]